MSVIIYSHWVNLKNNTRILCSVDRDDIVSLSIPPYAYISVSPFNTFCSIYVDIVIMVLINIPSLLNCTI